MSGTTTKIQIVNEVDLSKITTLNDTDYIRVINGNDSKIMLVSDFKNKFMSPDDYVKGDVANTKKVDVSLNSEKLDNHPAGYFSPVGHTHPLVYGIIFTPGMATTSNVIASTATVPDDVYTVGSANDVNITVNSAECSFEINNNGTYLIELFGSIKPDSTSASNLTFILEDINSSVIASYTLNSVLSDYAIAMINTVSTFNVGDKVFLKMANNNNARIDFESSIFKITKID